MRTRQSFVWRLLTVVFYVFAFFTRSSSQSKLQSSDLLQVAPNLLDTEIPDDWYLAREHGAMVGLPSLPPDYVRIDTKEFTPPLFQIEPRTKIPTFIKLETLTHRDASPVFFYKRVATLSALINHLHQQLGNDARIYYPAFSKYCYFLATNFGVRHKELLNDIVKLFKLSYLFYPANALGWRNKLDYLWDPAWAAFENQDIITSYIFFCIAQHTLNHQKLSEILQYKLPWYLADVTPINHEDFTIDAVIRSDRLNVRYSLNEIGVGDKIDKKFLKKYSFFLFYLNLLEHSKSPVSSLDLNLIEFLQKDLTVLNNLAALPKSIPFNGQNYTYEQLKFMLAAMHDESCGLIAHLEYERRMAILFYLCWATGAGLTWTFRQLLLRNILELLKKHFPGKWNPDYINVLNDLKKHPLLTNNNQAMEIIPHIKNIKITITLPSILQLESYPYLGNQIRLTTAVITNAAEKLIKDKFPNRNITYKVNGNAQTGFKLLVAIPVEHMAGLNLKVITKKTLLDVLIDCSEEKKEYDKKVKEQNEKRAAIRKARDEIAALIKELPELPGKHKAAIPRFTHFFDYANGILEEYVDEEVCDKAWDIVRSYEKFSDLESKQKEWQQLENRLKIADSLLKKEKLEEATIIIDSIRAQIKLDLAFDKYEAMFNEKKTSLDNCIKALSKNPARRDNELRRRSSSGKTSQEVLAEIINIIERLNDKRENVFQDVIYTLKNHIALFIDQLRLLKNKQPSFPRFKHNFIFLFKRLEYLILAESKNDVETKLKSFGQHLKETLKLSEITEVDANAMRPLIASCMAVSELEDNPSKLRNSQELLINGLNFLRDKQHQIRARTIEKDVAFQAVRGCFAVLGSHWEQMQSIKQKDVAWWDRSEHRNDRESRTHSINPLKKRSIRDLLVECKNPIDENTLFEELCEQAPSFIASLQRVVTEIDSESASTSSSSTSSSSIARFGN
jgi:hypothetical protein